MPKLEKKVASAVDKADAAGGSLLLPEGRYACQLRSVTESQGTEYPYWTWEFHNLHDIEGNKKPGRQWNNTSLSPKSVGFLKSTFEAFGYTSDSDTDEMIGEWVEIYVIQEVQERGKNAGKLRNQVQGLAEFDPNAYDFDAAEAEAGLKAKAAADADEY